jgi:hypothetical protein
MISHFVRMWIGLGTAAFMIALCCSNLWLPRHLSLSAFPEFLGFTSLPFVFAYIAYQAAAWRAQSAISVSSSGRSIGPSRVMIWLTGAVGLLWWSIAADWLLSLLVTFILLVLLMIQASAIAGRARYNAHRIWSDITACVCILVLILSAAWTSWPMRLLFHASRDQLEILANRVEAGQTIDVPVWIGPFRIARTEIRNEGQRGGTCLWVFPNPGHPTGLVRSDKPGVPGHNVNRRIRLSENWYYLSED